MLLQDKGINFAHTSLKESLSKITGSFAREKTAGSSKKSGALGAFLLDKEPWRALTAQPKARRLPLHARGIGYLQNSRKNTYEDKE